MSCHWLCTEHLSILIMLRASDYKYGKPECSARQSKNALTLVMAMESGVRQGLAYSRDHQGDQSLDHNNYQSHDHYNCLSHDHHNDHSHDHHNNQSRDHQGDQSLDHNNYQSRLISSLMINLLQRFAYEKIFEIFLQK
ncbi:hypothetical protein HELRODRAFT_168374 [Helobdella robusta]|uniref:Uncharacterized protein n=1 Tax=Helobdella robusta TaxID=6412 RepID=T1F0I1_HELRO|nr:hypothetical protein HELRODRAFT_168374 [Helobdella robusta]ESO09392.1 hypothetical protein HELRODRAFT_168374 [Helobdella robusta]